MKDNLIMTTNPLQRSKGDSTDQEILATDARLATRRPNIVLWVVSGIFFALFAAVLIGLASNEVFEWDSVLRYLAFPTVVSGLLMTLQLTVIAMALGIVGGVALAVMRMSPSVLLRIPADAFVWFFRGTPVLVQLIFWFNLAIFLPEIRIDLPFSSSPLFVLDTNEAITPFVASLLGLALNEAAYMCEIVRGGLLSVPHGQSEAAQSLGVGRFKTFTRIVLPQAMRAIVPPTGNQVISMLKGTSLVSVIAMSDLLYSVQSIYNQNFKVIPLLVVACIWYLAITTVLDYFQKRIERFYGRGTRR
ncbi:amino acid ABC transporter permease [Paenarthrobacter sp. NPDC090520]|uniref:amino acid ABC transporter permease n=1 Tax=Paenarthrobacter sp. NPDC090520 TaxID=3364382 RepID=UPI003813DC22